MVAVSRCTLAVVFGCAAGARIAKKRTDLAGDVTPQNIALNIVDCGGSSHIGRLAGYTPQSVSTGIENQIYAWGPVSEDVLGGTLDMNVYLTSFPWTNLGSFSNHNVCERRQLELRALGIWSGTLDYEGLNCPLSAGEFTVPIKLTLASTASGAETRADISGTASNGKPLLCATVLTSR